MVLENYLDCLRLISREVDRNLVSISVLRDGIIEVMSMIEYF